MKIYIVIILFISVLIPTSIWSQKPDALGIARHYVANEQYDSAALVYQHLYEESPYDMKIYTEFLQVLIQMKEFTHAHKLVDYMSEVKKDDPYILLDKVSLLQLQNKNKEKDKLLKEIVDKGSVQKDYELRKYAQALEEKLYFQEAITVYENGNKKVHAYPGYQANIIKLYIKGDMYESLFNSIVNGSGIPYEIYNEILPIIQERISKTENKNAFGKALKKYHNRQDPSGIINSIEHWFYNLDGNQATALADYIAKDKAQKGLYLQPIFQIGVNALENKLYLISNQAFEYLVQQEVSPVAREAYRFLARSYSEYLFQQLPVQDTDVQKALSIYNQLFTKYPEFSSQFEYLQYIDIIAKLKNQPDTAIVLLDNQINNNRLTNHFIGYAKLNQGDYYLLLGQNWEANLKYAQVEKMFKNDLLGEEARYRQAKLAFYRGDFEWAQMQLDILKKSTTELIANDAMRLSIMITENTVTDTNAIPLKMYAIADMYLYQHQYTQADSVLSNIIDEYPEHDIVDDVLMLKAQLATNTGKFSDALRLYDLVMDKYKDDVLADDATFQKAELYEKYLKDIEKATLYYEQVILDFPNSTLSTMSRTRLQNIAKSKQPG